MSTPGNIRAQILLARESKQEQETFVGYQTGGRVFLFLYTYDFWRDYTEMTSVGVTFIRKPSKAIYGTVAVVVDYYVNLWDLVQLNK